jgi:O-antigen/teichoic acid export membrane protein
MAAMSVQLALACVQGEHHFRALNLLRPLVVTLTAVCLTIVWLLVRHVGVVVPLGIVTAANVVGCVAGGIFLAVVPSRTNASATVSMRTLIRYGLASLAGGNAPLETLQADQAVVGVLLSRYDLGLYAVGSAFDNLPGILVSGVGMIALPRIASAARESRAVIMKRAIVLSGLLAAAATVFTEVIVGWLLPAAFGGAFVGAVTPARVLILAGFFMGMRRILVVFLQGVGRPGRTGVGESVALGTLLLLAALLVPTLGLVGASLSLLGAAISANMYLLWALRNELSESSTPAESEVLR